MGLFYPFMKDSGVRMIGVEAAGYGIATGKHAAPLCAGSVGVLHGNKTYLLQDEFGQITAGPLDLRRARLSRCRSGACLAQGERPGQLRLGDG